MRELAERAYFRLCLTLGRLLRSRYARVHVGHGDREREVRKRRARHAPLLIRMGNPLLGILDAGVRVLPQREWEARERELHRRMHGASVRVEEDGTLVLPWLAGRTLAALLDDPGSEERVRRRAIERAVAALAELHRSGCTHADAMAENVMMDLEGGAARWFDFETEHDADRPMAWRRADDVRALVATCLLRTAPDRRAETLRVILDAYADEEVTRLVAASFGSVWRRPLSFHLAQAGVSLRCFREIGRLLRARLGE